MIEYFMEGNFHRKQSFVLWSVLRLFLFFLQLPYSPAYCFCLVDFFLFAISFQDFFILIANSDTDLVWPGVIRWPACPWTHFLNLTFVWHKSIITYVWQKSSNFLTFS